MNWRFVGILCLVVVVLAQCVGFANDTTKVEQLPMMEGSFSFASDIQSQMMMADDWVCPDGNPINGIRWWGSYWTPPTPGVDSIYSDSLQNASGGNPPSFMIYIFSNMSMYDPNNGLGMDRPGTLLQEYDFTAEECNQTYYGTVVKSWNPDNTPMIYEDIYEYYVTLGSDLNPMFNQVEGEKYWLAILADDANDPNNVRQWGWHEGDGRWGTYGLQLVGMVDGPETGSWWMPCGGHDMAFELTTVPEPGSLCALAAGLVGLAGFIGKTRKSR